MLPNLAFLGFLYRKELSLAMGEKNVPMPPIPSIIY